MTTKTRTMTGTWDEFDTVYNLLWWQSTAARKAGHHDEHQRLEHVLGQLGQFPDQADDPAEVCWALPTTEADRAFVAVRLRHAARRVGKAARPLLYITPAAALELADRFTAMDPTS